MMGKAWGCGVLFTCMYVLIHVSGYGLGFG